MALSETPADPRTEFLHALALSLSGGIFIANLSAALRHEARLRTACALWLDSCVAEYARAAASRPREGDLALFVSRQVTERDHGRLFFQVSLPALPSVSVGLVVCASAFFPQSLVIAQREGSFLFPPQYFCAPPDELPVLYYERTAGLMDSGLNEDDLARLAVDIEEALENAPRRPGAPRPIALGRGCYAVFVTRSDHATWVELRDDARRDGRADALRDHLGVPWKRGEILLEIRVRRPLNELARDGRVVARPTAFEAWRHDFFRHRLQPGEDDVWGRTVDFSRLVAAAGPEAPVDGAPELVLDMLPLEPVEQMVEVHTLGEIGSDAAVSLQSHLDCLLGGRSIEQEIEILLQHLANEAA